jgi:hypothetical protein
VTAFTVPASYVYLLKSARAWNAGGAADTVDAWMLSAAGIVVNLWWNTTLATGGTLQIDGDFVLEVGDSVVVRSLLGTTRFWLGGTRLNG